MDAQPQKVHWAVAGWLGWLGIIPRTKAVPVQSPVAAGTGGDQSMFLSHIDVSLSLSLSPSLPLKN